jgi:hypothetical protein
VVLDFGSGLQTFVFWLMAVMVGVLGLLGLGTGLVAIFERKLRKGMALTCAVMLALSGWLGSAAWDRLERFETLTIEPDNAWVAENLAGGDVMRLGPDDLRAVDFKSRLVEGAPMTWIEIELPDGRRFASLEARESVQIEAMKALRAHIGAHR